MSWGEERPPPGGPVDPNSTSVEHAFAMQFVEGLPIFGQDYKDVLTLVPGVSDPGGDGSPNIHGSRETSVQYRLDSAEITDPADGLSATDLSPLSIEEIRLLTAGAGAEHGRSMGGFIDLTSRSGGNDFEGRFRVFFRSDFLDGDGASNEDGLPHEGGTERFHDLRGAVAAGGAFVRDSAWYYASLEGIDQEIPAGSPADSIFQTARRAFYFAKVTGQAGAFNRLSLQTAGDPARFDNLGIDRRTSPDSGFDQDQGSRTTLLTWDSTISSTIQLEAGLAWYDFDLSAIPSSDDFERFEAPVVAGSPGARTVQYPCEVLNCDRRLGERRMYTEDRNGAIFGPWFAEVDQERSRWAVRADASLFLEDALGAHTIRTGFETSLERLEEDVYMNPTLIDATSPRFGGQPNSVTGLQVIQVLDPADETGEAETLNLGLYVSDSWKPIDNLAINVGLRLDREEADSRGWDPFDPREDRSRSNALWGAVCQEALRQMVPLPPQSNCLAVSYNGQLPQIIPGTIMSFLDQDMNGVNDVAG